MRFNNPYRLQTELGNNAESLSLSATYTDLQLGAVVDGGVADRAGIGVHGSIALDGVPQEVISPSYVLFVRLDPRWALVGRAGLPIVVEPDLNVGFEASGGGLFYLTAGLGVTASLVGSLFYGAATLERSRTAIPLLSLEARIFLRLRGAAVKRVLLCSALTGPPGSCESSAELGHDPKNPKRNAPPPPSRVRWLTTW